MSLGADRNKMVKAIHFGRRKASGSGKARAGRSAHIMNPEYLAVVENFQWDANRAQGN